MVSQDNRMTGKIRLYISEDLSERRNCSLIKSQHHYLRNVMRCQSGEPILVFNGRDGEWLAEISQIDKKAAVIQVRSQTRPQSFNPDIHVLFAPVKKARLDYMVQKATEMGASSLVPVMTQYTQKTRLNYERLKANMVEAAEQCNLLNVPELCEAINLEQALQKLDNTSPARSLIFCDESAGAMLTKDSRDALEAIKSQPVAVLIGPEGGFSSAERLKLYARPDTLTISLGPRILRADTALVAALSLCQMTIGDWV